MKSTMRLLACAVLGLAVTGCSSDDEPRHDKTTLDQIPVAVRRGIDKEFPDAAIKRIEKETYENGVIHYKVQLVSRFGHGRDVEFAEDGELLNKPQPQPQPKR